MGEPPNSSRNSIRGTERAGELEVCRDLPSESAAVELPRSPSVLTTEASYPWVEGPGWEVAEEALCLLKKIQDPRPQCYDRHALAVRTTYECCFSMGTDQAMNTAIVLIRGDRNHLHPFWDMDRTARKHRPPCKCSLNRVNIYKYLDLVKE